MEIMAENEAEAVMILLPFSFLCLLPMRVDGTLLYDINPRKPVASVPFFLG